MRRVSLIAFVATFSGSAAVAAAQQPAPAPPRSAVPAPPAPHGDECVTLEPGRIECRRVIGTGGMRGMGGMTFGHLDSAMANRAALGMQLSATGSARDTLGVFVAAVTPKGPAESAGIIEGDRIVSISGVDLRVAAADVEDGYASGLPAHRLSREMGKLTPGAIANLRVYSGGRVRDVRVTAARASDLMKSRSLGAFGGGGSGSMFFYRDGMPEMSPMARMPQMPRMRLMPGLEGVRAFEFDAPHLRMLEGRHSDMLRSHPAPRVRLRVNSSRNLTPEQKARIEKAKADSLKKAPKK